MTEIDKALALSDETEIVIRLGEITWAKTVNSDDDFSNLSEPEKVVLYIEMLESEVNNGGFEQFFYNTSGDYAHEIQEACETIAANKTATIIERAIQNFPILPVPKDTDARREIMENISQSTLDAWEELDQEFFKYDDNIAGLLIEYVKVNKSSFQP